VCPDTLKCIKYIKHDGTFGQYNATLGPFVPLASVVFGVIVPLTDLFELLWDRGRSWYHCVECLFVHCMICPVMVVIIQNYYSISQMYLLDMHLFCDKWQYVYMYNSGSSDNRCNLLLFPTVSVVSENEDQWKVSFKHNNVV